MVNSSFDIVDKKKIGFVKKAFGSRRLRDLVRSRYCGSSELEGSRVKIIE